MNKTLALLTMIGLVASAPAFAGEEGTVVKKSETKVEKTIVGSKEAATAPAAGDTTKTEVKTEVKTEEKSETTH